MQLKLLTTWGLIMAFHLDLITFDELQAEISRPGREI